MTDDAKSDIKEREGISFNESFVIDLLLDYFKKEPNRMHLAQGNPDRPSEIKGISGTMIIIDDPIRPIDIENHSEQEALDIDKEHWKDE